MADYYLKSGNNADWAALAVKVSGDRVVASRSATAARKVRVFECTTGGTTGASEPAWNTTIGGTTSDGSVTWTTRAPTTWANAHRYLDHMTHTAASGSVTSGDRVFVSSAHSESFTGNSLLTENIASKDNPYQVLCVSDDTTEPPTTLATGAVVACSATYRIRGHAAYFYGIKFRVGVASSGSFQPDCQVNTTHWVRFENCIIELAGTSGTVDIGDIAGGPNGAGQSCEVYFINVEIQLAVVGNLVNVYSCLFNWFDGSITGVAPTSLLGIPNGNSRKMLIEGVDLSLAATNLLAVSANNTGQHGDDVTFRNCKIGASVAQIQNAPVGTGVVLKVINCSSGSENYKYKSRNYYGDVDHETTLVRTGGASDGATPLSWKMVTTANAKRTQPLYSPWIAIWNEGLAARTLALEILHDSVTALKDNEVWIEVLYLGSSATPKATFTSDASNALAAGASQASSSATWTTTGMTNPNKQVCAVSITPQMKGVIRVRLAVAAASKTLYVDPFPLGSGESNVSRQFQAAAYDAVSESGSSSGPPLVVTVGDSMVPQAR